MRTQMGRVLVGLLAVLALAGCGVGTAGGATAPAGVEPPAGGVQPVALATDALTPAVTSPPPAPGTATDAALPEEALIYAAVIRQLYTVDHTFGDSPPNWPRVYVLKRTDDTIAGTGEEDAASRELAGPVQEAVTTALGDLPAEIIWVAAWDEVPISDEDGAVDQGDGIIITLGNIHEQEEGTVHVPASLHCGGLCATGMTYILELTPSGWTVTGTDGPVWMS